MEQLCVLIQISTSAATKDITTVQTTLNVSTSEALTNANASLASSATLMKTVTNVSVSDFTFLILKHAMLT